MFNLIIGGDLSISEKSRKLPQPSPTVNHKIF